MGVFEEFVDRAKDVADAATKKTGEVVEKSRLKMRIMRVNAQIKEAYERLGEVVYKAQKTKYENTDLINSIKEEIDDSFELLKSLNRQLEEISNVLVCNVCSEKNPDSASYCLRCGNKLTNEFTGYDDIVNESEESMQEEEDLMNDTRVILHEEVKEQESANAKLEEEKPSVADKEIDSNETE